jgi:D-arabinose 1-dehydrogenase-like Zn-dependent alcohol dehydrogenase
MKVGDKVVGVTMFGGQSSHVKIPRTQLFPLPSTMSEAEAAAFPAVALTAYYAVHELAHVRPGDVVLVHRYDLGRCVLVLDGAVACAVVYAVPCAVARVVDNTTPC